MVIIAFALWFNGQLLPDICCVLLTLM